MELVIVIVALLSGCVAAPEAKDRPSRVAPETSTPIEPTSLMNPGDEVDDDIWARRPRNRLQPGQTTAPDPRSRVASVAPLRPDSTAVATTGAPPTTGVSLPIETLPSSRASAPVRDRQQPVAAATPAPKAKLNSAETPESSSTTPGTGAEGKPIWSIALATFSGEDHRDAADAACQQFVQKMPELKGAFVRSIGSGSVMMWGEFDGPKDPRAQPELKRLKEVSFGGNRPFARAMLSRLEQFSEEEMGPWDLRQVRRRHPNVRVIYTLQVAAWSDLGSGTMKFEQIRRSAEDYCRQLRAQGAEAWFHHDADLMTSIVTVGVFDRRAYDAQSTLYSPEVENVRRRYPTSLLNGEEVFIKPDPAKPEETKSQPSRLVEVPH